MEGKIFSPGKVLLTSEYVVLDGALALAVPTQLGQEFFFKESEKGNHTLTWEAFHQNRPWLSIQINYKSWTILETNNKKAAEFVLNTLKNVQKLSSLKFQSSTNYHFKTNLQFPGDFGLGSSSTLMCNLAEWAQIDAYVLNEIALGGSGYDIAVAKEKAPILYQLSEVGRMVQKIDFLPQFRDQLILIHLNQKQDTREGILHYRSKVKSVELIDQFSQITKNVLDAQTIDEFVKCMQDHENVLASFLELPTAKQKYFPEYGGLVKSLGAWGGDFVIASKFGDYKTYFSTRNFTKIFDWDQIIL